MFDVAYADYDEASFYTAEDAGEARALQLAERLASHLVVDPRLSLALIALALGLAASGTALLVSFAAVAALVLGVVMRPQPASHETRYGAFTAVELGFLMWSCDPRGAVASAANLRVTAAFAVFALASAATLVAGLAGLAPQVVLAGAVSFAALIATRVVLAALVRGGAA